jgi:hypothetical protein
MSWIPGVSAAIGGIQSIVGLFGANSAQQRAEQAAQQAITQYQSNANQAYNDTAQAGQGNLYALSGQLSNQLQRQGGALGQALANAGVYNSTAAAGALANQGAANAGALSQEQSALGASLNQLKDQTGMQAAQMQYGLNQNNLNYARNLYGQSIGGVQGFLQNLGKVSGIFGNPTTPPATQGMQGNGSQSALGMQLGMSGGGLGGLLGM